MLKSKIDSYYVKHDCERVSQGDILRDFSFIVVGKGGALTELKFPYIVVLSQDCDLEHGSKLFEKQNAEPKAEILKFNQYLHCVLFSPAFPSDTMRDGKHFAEMLKIEMDRINSDKYRVIESKENSRYHVLPKSVDLQIPDLLIDFKAYYTVPFETFNESYKSHYLVTTNELFRESLSQRFAFYLNRVGVPEIPVKAA